MARQLGQRQNGLVVPQAHNHTRLADERKVLFLVPRLAGGLEERWNDRQSPTSGLRQAKNKY